MDPTKAGQSAAAVFALGFVSRAMQIAQRQKEHQMLERLTQWEADAIIAEAADNKEENSVVIGHQHVYIVTKLPGRVNIISFTRGSGRNVYEGR